MILKLAELITAEAKFLQHCIGELACAFASVEADGCAAHDDSAMKQAFG